MQEMEVGEHRRRRDHARVQPKRRSVSHRRRKGRPRDEGYWVETVASRSSHGPLCSPLLLCLMCTFLKRLPDDKRVQRAFCHLF